MQYVDYEAFYEYVLPEVHGCPKSMAKTAIRDSVIEFCDQSMLWTAPSATTDIVEGEARYAFAERDDGAIVNTLIFAAVEDNPIKIISAHSLSQYAPEWRNYESSSPDVIFMDTHNTIRLVGTPTESIENGLYLEVSLKPSRTSTTCPEFILENWAETIAHGALARLKAMVGRTWADGSMVSYHRNEFRSGLSRARSAMQKSRQVESKTMFAQNFIGI